MVPQFQHVYEVVVVSRGHLHQTDEPLERAVGVVLCWEGRCEEEGEWEEMKNMTSCLTSKSTANSLTLMSCSRSSCSCSKLLTWVRGVSSRLPGNWG